MKQSAKPIERQPREDLSYEVVIKDKDGKELQRVSAPSRSFVAQWNKLLNVLAKQTALTIKDTGGVDRSVTPASPLLDVKSGIGVVAYGLRCGKGSTPVDITDYALQSPIAEGTGSDQLSHREVQWTYPAVDGSDCSFTIFRVMINYSGATITGIREIGAYGRGSPSLYLVFRDVLGSALSVPDGGSITVTYTIKVTV